MAMPMLWIVSPTVGARNGESESAAIAPLESAVADNRGLMRRDNAGGFARTIAIWRASGDELGRHGRLLHLRRSDCGELNRRTGVGHVAPLLRTRVAAIFPATRLGITPTNMRITLLLLLGKRLPSMQINMAQPFRAIALQLWNLQLLP
ncbi:hypothetical protein H8A97_06465 [Bradyrhizobium sp. Arg62]|uniref:hypothetical protein n=1 Tax=Bradyrhizobium brasilense TaxID=1419277 RepID=UPI001E2B0954|nr:hypothetical protein [Bradyrhizobium brasilense]MCC8944763.1 hypothetical protein [Bradyrhizobium brasilense]MCP1913202.1 hypothetical protein [Bradyrhizobium elkanii]